MGRRALVVSIAAVASLTVATPSRADVAFGRELSFQADGLVTSVAVGDLNGDGNIDVVAPYEFAGTIFVPDPPTRGVLTVLGDGRAGGTTSNQPLSVALNSVVLADFNSDGKLDAAGTFDNSDSSRGVEVLLGNGNGALTETSPQAAGTHPANIVSADFNRDGKPDVAVTDGGTNNILVLVGTGSGTFAAPTTVALTRTPSHLTAADVNGDGKPDLVAATDGGIVVLHGDGMGAFPSTEGVAVQGGANGTAVGDVNADGVADIAVVTSAQNTATVLLGRVGGGFTAMPLPVAGPRPRQVVIADLDLDGLPDLGIFGTETGEGTFGVYLGDGRGSFTGYATFMPGRVGGVIADYNRDGAPDVVIGSGQSPKSRQPRETVQVALNLPVLAGESLDFGRQSVRLGQKTRTLTLRNTGAAPMHVTAVSLGTGSRHFSIADDGCAGKVVPRRQTCPVKLAFRPRRLGVLSAGVMVSADTSVGSQSFPLTGIGKRLRGVGVRRKTLKLDDRGRVHLRVSCPGPRRCKGVLTIRSTNALVLRTPGTPRHIAIGTTRLNLGASARKTVAVVATATARAVLRRLGRLAVTVRVSGQGAYVSHVAFATHLRRRR